MDLKIYDPQNSGSRWDNTYECDCVCSIDGHWKKQVFDILVKANECNKIFLHKYQN